MSTLKHVAGADLSIKETPTLVKKKLVQGYKFNSEPDQQGRVTKSAISKKLFKAWLKTILKG